MGTDFTHMLAGFTQMFADFTHIVADFTKMVAEFTHIVADFICIMAEFPHSNTNFIQVLVDFTQIHTDKIPLTNKHGHTQINKVVTQMDKHLETRWSLGILLFNHGFMIGRGL